MEKIAFLFLTVGEHFQSKWWQRFLDGNSDKYNIYVHSKNNPIQDALFYGHILENKINTNWGDVSLVKVQNLLLKEALKDPDNTRFVFVSESCVPIKPFDYIYNVLTRDETSYMYQIGIPPGLNIRWWCSHLKSRYMPFAKACFKHKISLITPLRFVLEKHSQWVILTKDIASIAANDTKYIKLFENIRCCDEHYYTRLFYSHSCKTQVNRAIKTTHFNRICGYTHPSVINHLTKDQAKSMSLLNSFFIRKVLSTSNIYDFYDEIMNEFAFIDMNKRCLPFSNNDIFWSE